MASYKLYAQLPLQQVCQQRQFSALIKWAAYITAQPIPVEKPSVSFVQQRVVAALIPIHTNSYVTQTIGFTVESPDVQTNIHTQLNAFNDEATEAAMDANVEAAVSAAMPQFCATTVTQAQVDQWLIANGFPTE